MLSSLVLLSASQPAPVLMPATQEPVDTMVQASGRELHFVLYRGRLPVTILLEAGGGADLTSWADVPRMVARETGATVVSYDRAGLGRSELGDK
jgi:hypothetical protein